MLPVLLDLRIIKIYTLGVFLVIGFFWALFWFWRNLKRTSFKEEEMFDAVFLSLLGGLFFSRLTFVLLNFEDFGSDILRFILINGYPGLSLTGALIGGLFTLLLYTRIARLEFQEVIAYIVPSLFLAIGIGKLGEFFAGTTVGTETTFPLSVQYVGFEGQRHIVSVYEALIMFIGFAASQQLLRSFRRENIEPGTLLSFFIIVVSLMYLSLDFLKANPLYLLSFRFNVVVPGVMLILFSTIELMRYRKSIVRSLQKVFKKKKKRTEEHG